MPLRLSAGRRLSSLPGCQGAQLPGRSCMIQMSQEIVSDYLVNLDVAAPQCDEGVQDWCDF